MFNKDGQNIERSNKDGINNHNSIQFLDWEHRELTVWFFLLGDSFSINAMQLPHYKVL